MKRRLLVLVVLLVLAALPAAPARAAPLPPPVVPAGAFGWPVAGVDGRAAPATEPSSTTARKVSRKRVSMAQQIRSDNRAIC